VTAPAADARSTHPGDRVTADLGLDPAEVRRFVWPARPGRTARWPTWLPADVVSAITSAGIAAPWRHQVDAAEAAVAGRHVVLATGTASGKSLAYLMPVLAATYGGTHAIAPSPAGDRPADPAGVGVLELLTIELAGPVGQRPHTAIYLAPTKALAHDQFRAARAVGPPGWRIATLDGDTEPAARDWVREWGTYVLSNPDMLHHSVLPQHQRWAPLLRRLRYVVVDEAHRYRGVFGAQVAAVLGRLRRLAHHYGADPAFVLAAATIAEPAGSAARLLGVDPKRIVVVDADDSARPARELLLLGPSDRADELTAVLLARCVDSGRQTLAFTRSRRAAESVALRARQLAASRDAVRIEAYRAGYLPQDRRAIEAGLRSGDIRGVASTNALELGVDIVGLDAVVIDGFPGTRSSFWQQAGRAGRSGTDALAVLVAGRHPLDRFLVEHPEALVDRPVEAAVLHPANPHVLRPQLVAAAQELPLRSLDRHYFGPTTESLATELARAGALRLRPNGWYATGADPAHAAVDLRAAGARIDLVEEGTGRIVGVVDEATADLCAHEGAVYVHRGDTYLCQPVEDEAEVMVRPAQPGYVTSPRRETEIRIVSEQDRRAFGGVRISFGSVDVSSRVTGYLRRDPETGTIWDHTPLDLPARTVRTAGVWWTLDAAIAPENVGLDQLVGGAHAAEHAWLNLLPAFAPCEVWDIGSSSAVIHPDTGRLTVIVHDAAAGGAGFAEHGYAVAEDWLRATVELVATCDCPAGCPGCVVSASCSTTGRPLDKATARLVLEVASGD
jgi:DEAD/DEAH box helicase domain-containing protein